jgi:hypothetical protein
MLQGLKFQAEMWLFEAVSEVGVTGKLSKLLEEFFPDLENVKCATL